MIINRENPGARSHITDYRAFSIRTADHITGANASGKPFRMYAERVGNCNQRACLARPARFERLDRLLTHADELGQAGLADAARFARGSKALG